MYSWEDEMWGSVVDPAADNPGGYSASIPTASNVDWFGAARGTLSDLLAFALQRDQLDAQVQIAATARQVQPTGVSSVFPYAQGTNMQQYLGLALIAGAALLGLKLAKVI